MTKKQSEQLEAIGLFLYANREYEHCQEIFQNWSENNSMDHTLEMIDRLVIAQRYLDHRQDKLAELFFNKEQAEILDLIEKQRKEKKTTTN